MELLFRSVGRVISSSLYLVSIALALLYLLAVPVFAQVNVTTYHNDLARTGQNTNETSLTLANVNTNTFGQLFKYRVDGQVYAQPLYVSNLPIPGQGTHNVLFIVTQHNSIYAFDADSNDGPNGGLLWHTNLGPSAVTPNNDFGNRYGPYHDIDPEVGITSTPVIDLNTGTLYLDAFTHEGSSYYHRIHALKITNGLEQPYGPVFVSASVPGVTVDSTNGVVPFVPSQHLQRPALTLAAGVLYVCYSGYADSDPYHGWVIGFRSTDLHQLTNYVFNTTPNATAAAWGSTAAEGGIWMSGNGVSVDDHTNLFFEVGNGSFDLTNAAGTDYGDCFIKLSTTNGLAVADFFCPFNQAALSANDTDLGSGGPLLLPDSVGSAAHPHLLVGCGKEGKIYLLDRDQLGRFNSFADTNIVQELPGAVGGTWSSPAYFNGQVYYQGSGDVMKAFQIANGALTATPISRSSTSFGWPGATPAISANGTADAIAWVVQCDGYPTRPAILHAYNATNLALELYNTSQAGIRDTMTNTVKFVVPTVANGKVYAGAQQEVAVFGLGLFLAVPTISPAGGVFTNSVSVSLSESTPGASIYYTLDGSVPSTNSTRYSSPFVLTNSAQLNIRAFASGYIPSPTVGATFLNSSSSVLAARFLKQEFYPGATRANLEDPTYTTPPSFINYLSSFETPSGQGSTYAERVSGFFIPPVTTNYVFFLCSDDDSDLFLSTDSSPAHKQLIARESAWSNSRQWTSSSGGSVVAYKRSDQFTNSTWPGGSTIHLVAGTMYYLEGDHHQGNGGDDFAATFKFAGAPDPVNGAAPNLTGATIATYAYDNTVINITSPPIDTVAVQGTTAAFTIGAVSGYLGGGAGPGPAIVYQWQAAPAGSSLFTNLPNATAASFVTPFLAAADNGTRFRVVLSTAGSSVTSTAATLTVVTDTTPPVPVRVLAVNPAGTQVTIAFSEPLDSTSAQSVANYKFGSVSPTNAVLDSSGSNVTLATANPLPQGTAITLSITGVRDLSGNPVPPGTTILFSYSASSLGGYGDVVLADNPLGYWRLNENAGPTAIDAVGLHNGSYASAATAGVAGPRPASFQGFETTNNAVQTFINTANSFVSVPFGSLGANNVTVIAWLYPQGVQTSWAGLLMTRGSGGASGGMTYNNQQMLGYTWNNNSSATYNFVSGLSIPTNTWSLAAMVIYPDKAILYLANTNGVRSATNAIPHTADVFANNWQIGHDDSSGNNNGTRNYNGLIDEVAVFNQSLSPARIASYYQTAIQGPVFLTNGPVTPSTLQFTSIKLVSGKLVLQWLGAATLEQAPEVTGPWSPAPNQTNPLVTAVSSNSFFRLHR